MDILGKNNVRVNFKKADSSSKEFAFMKAHELNNIEHFTKVQCDMCKDGFHAGYDNKGHMSWDKCPRCNGYGHYYTKNIWRTGKNTNTQLIVETDNPSKENLSFIINHLEKLFCYKFNAIKTLHGFHIIGTNIYPTFHNQNTHKEEASLKWIYANALVLNNELNINNSPNIVRLMQDYITKILKMDEELREYQYSTNYKALFTNSLKTSGLLNTIGEFDILYTVLSLKYGKSTLRISKKQDNDKYEEVKI